MNKISFYFVLPISILCGCNSNPRATEKSVSVEIPTKDQNSIKGVWVIKKYVFGDITGMEDSVAAQWLNKRLEIKDSLFFEFDKIPAYRELFKKDKCVISDINSSEKIDLEKYLDDFKTTPEQLGLKSKSATVFHSSCEDNPFSQFILMIKMRLLPIGMERFLFLVRCSIRALPLTRGVALGGAFSGSTS